ncbi:MAG: hypothetical protein AB8I08_10630 [Sandaracinaceae bacterium]
MAPASANLQENFSGTPEAFLARCDALELSDIRSETIERSLTMWGVVLFLGGFGGACVVGMSFPDYLLWMAIPLGLGVLLFLIGRFFARGDLENRKYEIARHLVKSLAAELKPGRPVEMTLDFRTHQDTRPETERVDRSTQKLRYRQQWLSASLVLLDGTRTRITISADAKRKERRKPKGTKRKERSIERLSVVFIPPKASRFGAFNIGRRLDAPGAIHFQSGEVKPERATFAWRSEESRYFSYRGTVQRSGEGLRPAAVLGAVVASHRASRIASARDA